VGCKGRKKQVACAGNRQRFYFKFLLLYSLIIFLRRIISLENFYSLIKLIQITKFTMLHHVSRDPMWAVGLKNKKGITRLATQLGSRISKSHSRVFKTHATNKCCSNF
jgi:hypothetical protein